MLLGGGDSVKFLFPLYGCGGIKGDKSLKGRGRPLGGGVQEKRQDQRRNGKFSSAIAVQQGGAINSKKFNTKGGWEFLISLFFWGRALAGCLDWERRETKQAGGHYLAGRNDL